MEFRLRFHDPVEMQKMVESRDACVVPPVDRGDGS